MVIQLTSFLTNKPRLHRPILNAVPIGSPGSRVWPLSFDYKKFWNWFRQTPELVATISIPITDLLGDRPDWVSPDGKPLGRNKRMAAERFWREQRGKEVVRAWLYDAFLTGDGFLWKADADGDIRNAVAQELARGYYNRGIRGKELTLFTKEIEDEVVTRTRKIDYLAASTVTIVNDEHDILYYEQRSQGRTEEFSTDEIIHYRYLMLDGKVNGFSPVQALASEITLLWLVKGNMLSFMRNGGSPDKIFILPKEIARSKNHQFLIENLRKYKQIENRHGSLVFAGDVKVEDLQGLPKDLEYKDLALYITSNFAFAFNIPITRIPYLIGTAATKGDSGGLSEAGYWNKISDLQDTVEDLLNWQLFNEMGWAIKFQRRYKQDEVREAQIVDTRADTVIKVQDILQKNRKQLTTQKILSLLSGNEDWSFTDESIEALDEGALLLGDAKAQLGTNQNRAPNLEVSKEPDNRQRAHAKRNVMTGRDAKAAQYNP